MTLRIADRVMESTTTTGTGALALDGAYTGFIRFSAVPSIATNDTAYICTEALDANGNPSGDWEVTLATYSSANTLTRTTVLFSSNAGAAVNFGVGTKRVMLVASATHLALFSQKANNLSDLTNAGTARANLGVAIGSQVQAWDADLDALAALSGTNTLYYRSASNTWSAVTIGTNLTFSGGVLAATSSSPEGALTKPTASIFTLQNTGTASVSDVSNGVLLTVPTVGSGTIRFLKHTAGPSSFTSFSMVVRSRFVSFDSSNSYNGCIILRNSSSGKIIIFTPGFLRGAQYVCQRWSNYTTFSATSFGATTYAGVAMFPWMKIDVSGGVATFSIGPDGVNWSTVGTETIATYITSVDEVGVGCMSNADPASCIFQSFTIA